MREISTMRGFGRPIGILAIVFCLAMTVGRSAAQQPAPAAPVPIPAATCLGCHGSDGFSVPNPKGGTRDLHIDKDKFFGSVHGTRNCVDCHKQITEVPHQKLDRIQVDCVTCHRESLDDASVANNARDITKLTMVTNRIDRYFRSIHARPSNVDQSQTNATCYNCHNPHYVYPMGTTVHEEWRANLPATCGKCHDTEFQLYKTSVHGREFLEKHNTKAAICTDCHTSHDIESPFINSIQLVITQNCGGCHKENLASYLETYHGQVNKLGYTYTAKCFDCHGSHAIERVDDPRARVSPGNILTTCQQCHANATQGFTTFQPHANTHDFARYPYTWLASKFMLLLLGGTLSFFWLHSALWYYRELREHQAQKNIPHVRAEGVTQVTQVAPAEPKAYYRRWPAGWRLAHLLFALTVIMLVFTGMTLFYADSFWAPLVQSAFGGPRVTGTVHRVFAVTFVTIFILHFIYVTVRIVRNWKTFKWFGPDSFIPNLKDLKDCYGMFKWFLGRGERPEFDRWSYWEKFDYWAPFWGVTIIGVSGAMLWAKEFTASLLPGWVFNVAMIFHAEEAVLAAGFLFTVHFFNNHWRPENFPLDILMFTGAMPLEKFKREHRIDYDRLVASGELKDYLVDAPSRPLTFWSKVLGFLLMAVGLILLILIMVGFTRRMFGG
jgi:cytochrome b subunit of formate dehydrogenase